MKTFASFVALGLTLLAFSAVSDDKSFMVKGHEEMLQLLKTEIASGQDAAVKAFAQEMLPTVESHLKEARRLTGKEGAASTN